MSHTHDHENTVPGPALASAMALVLACLGLATASSLGFVDRLAVPEVTRAEANVGAVVERSLRFTDQADGTVLVSDADNGETVAVIDMETQSGGFVRGVMRGMARERRMHSVGAEPPFALTLWEDGSLSLVDTATSRSIELGAFGPDNRTVFLEMLDQGDAS
ncbi:photosynthetic complex assembly protein PuhC [Erythrobacter sp. EC-HK427]|uniref:photosynthetic complex assembly protein PuhC n=1 Tax=Erythrobacter sp. EC-HK427 TaxID=2038396 RepID=UPI00125C1029|nr:photosynthetic complex assembly protein PuhC [Erythrobacter sp. EC-HK427]VVT11090.1 conserved hypothetical protein [Erythrobacter sp. EC-HK427]